MFFKENDSKRGLGETPRPGGQLAGGSQPGFVVHRHQESHLHFDFRLKMDHPLDYIDFAGQIPQGQYGAGTVEIWDRG